MVDLHCHLIWGMDDGPQTIQQSVAMLELAASSGTTDIVATPHLNRKFTFTPEVISTRVQELSAQFGDAVRIHRGCDLHLSYENVFEVLRRHDRYTVNGGRFLMVEVPDLVNPAAATPVLRRLVDAAIVPIITHPERHELLRRDFESLRRWILEGCLIQVTAGSLSGRFGVPARKSGWSLVDRGLAHFIASDAHDARDRTPRLDAVYELVSRRLGSERADSLLVTNPSFVIRNEPLPHTEVMPPASPRKWFQFWRS